LSFFLPFILLFTKAIKDRNAFEIYFIGFSLIAFFFNRIIWMIPLNYIFFTFLGVFENSDYKINSSSNNQLKRHS